MYKIYADDTLIYDSTIDDYKINKGLVTLETNKSGSFVFAVYPDHFYYDLFVRLKTVIRVFKAGKIVFRGRVLNDVVDYWNNKILTCEGELGFLQDSVIRPFTFNGTPEALFKKFIEEHNSQVDEFKRFKIGRITVTDPNNYIARSNSYYESTFDNMNSRLLDSDTGGNFFITHGDDGLDDIPTIHYLADFENMSSQSIVFGENLKDYTKTTRADDIGTAIIPLGAEIEDGDDAIDNPRLTIKSVNNDVDYVYNSDAVALRGWIFKVVTWEDVTDPANLKRKAEEYLEALVQQIVTIELNAIDLHLLDHDIESFKLGDYIHVVSPPHNFDATLLCSKQTIDLLKPENDTVILGYTYSSFTEASGKLSTEVKQISTVKHNVEKVNNRVSDVKEETMSDIIDISEAIVTHVGDAKNPHNVSIEQIGAMGFHGVAPIKATSDDTIEKWKALPPGFYWFNIANCLTDQPGQYGFLLHMAYSSDVVQLWFTQSAGSIYVRSGNASGWARTWTEFTLKS